MVTHGVDAARKVHPDAKVEIVDLRNYFALLKRKLMQTTLSPSVPTPGEAIASWVIAAEGKVDP